MIGKPRSPGQFDEGLQPSQVIAVQRLGRAEVHRHPVLHDAIPFEDLIEVRQCSPAADHKVFRDDFKPVNDRFAAEDVVVVGDAQPDADTVVLKVVKSVSGHMPLRRSLQISNHVRIVSQRDAAGTGV
jgi:hypothetical protein